MDLYCVDTPCWRMPTSDKCSHLLDFKTLRSNLLTSTKQDWLQCAYAHAATKLKHAQQHQHTGQLRNYVNSASHLQGVYPPLGSSYSDNDSRPIWSVAPGSTVNDLQQALAQHAIVVTLLHSLDDIKYTDGSKQDLRSLPCLACLVLILSQGQV